MKILFLTTRNPSKQGDYMEMCLVHGLRSILGENFVEYPRKKIMYGDFSESPKNSLHGKGFSLLTRPIPDVRYDRNNLKVKDFDVVLMGSGHIYGEEWMVAHDNIWYTDGHDLYGNAPKMMKKGAETVIAPQFDRNCFKREYFGESIEGVYSTGFGIPSYQIRPFNFEDKTQLFQSTAPSDACFYENSAYKFDNEDAYYDDMSRSWFGLSCKKGGVDCLRHYEIMASGALLLFKDYKYVRYEHFHCLDNLIIPSYSTKEELESLMNELVRNNKPTKQYMEFLIEQRKWLYSNGTTQARALHIVDTISKYSI